MGDWQTSVPLLMMLGSLGAAIGAMVNFWLGSKKGSDHTKELLARRRRSGCSLGNLRATMSAMDRRS